MVPTAILPLPREIEGDPACAAIRARLADTGRLLWPRGEAVVSVLPLGTALADALRATWRDGRLVLGLEGATAALATEARGLAAGPPGMRVSRLLLLSDDGAERLYRHAERLKARRGAAAGPHLLRPLRCAAHHRAPMTGLPRIDRPCDRD